MIRVFRNTYNRGLECCYEHPHKMIGVKNVYSFLLKVIGFITTFESTQVKVSGIREVT